MKITIEQSTINMSLELNGNPANYADQLHAIISSITSESIRKPKSEDFEVYMAKNLMPAMVIGIRSRGDCYTINGVTRNPEYLILSKVESVTDDKNNKKVIIETQHGIFTASYSTQAVVLYNESLYTSQSQN